MGVVVSVQEVGPCRKELTIEVPAPAVEAETQRVTREYARQARLPGFRRGKVPAGVARKRFSKEIEQEVLERLLPRYWHQAEAEESLEALMAPTVGDVELSDGEPLKFIATVEVRPPIELSADRNFDLPSADVRVGDAEVDEVIDQMLHRLAPWKEVDREAARGDRVLLRLREDGAEHGEGKENDEQEADEVHIEVGDPRVWDELMIAVTGMKAGQRNEFTRQEPAPPAAEGEEPTEAPPPRHFRLEVVEVAEKELSELDDEVAKKLGEVDDVADLRAKIEAGLLREKAEQRSNERQQALVGQLIERHPLALPEGVVKQEAQSMVEDYARGMTRQGVDPNQAGIDFSQMAGEVQPQAEKRVHARLLLDALADDDGVEVDEEEVESTIRAIAKAEGRSALAVRRALDEDSRLTMLKKQLRRDKTMRILLGEEPAQPSAQEPESEDTSSSD